MADAKANRRVPLEARGSQNPARLDTVAKCFRVDAGGKRDRRHCRRMPGECRTLQGETERGARFTNALRHFIVTMIYVLQTFLMNHPQRLCDLQYDLHRWRAR